MPISLNDNTFVNREPILSNGYVIYYDDVEDQYTNNIYVDFEDMTIQISRMVVDAPSFNFLSAKTIRLQLLSKKGITVGTYVFETSDGHESSLNLDWGDTSNLHGFYSFDFKKYVWVPALKDLPN